MEEKWKWIILLPLMEMPLYKSIPIDLVEVEVIQHIFNQISDQSHKKWEYTSWSCPHHVNGITIGCPHFFCKKLVRLEIIA